MNQQNNDINNNYAKEKMQNRKNAILANSHLEISVEKRRLFPNRKIQKLNIHLVFQNTSCTYHKPLKKMQIYKNTRF